MAEGIQTRREPHLADPVAVAVGEFLIREIVAQRQGLKDHRMVTTRPRLEVEQERGGAGDLIRQAAAHAHSQVE